jgi:hypothetical protein
VKELEDKHRLEENIWRPHLVKDCCLKYMKLSYFYFFCDA